MKAASARFPGGRIAAVCAAGLLLSGCAVSRLEDIPSTAAIDAKAAGAQASLSTPPKEYLTAALPSPPASLEQSSGEAAGLASPLPAGVQTDGGGLAQSPPNGFVPGTLPGGATWLVRYGAEGFDAEDADGNYCSGQVLDGSAEPRPGLKVKLACNSGEMAQLVINSAGGGAGTGSILLGGEERKAVIR